LLPDGLVRRMRQIRYLDQILNDVINDEHTRRAFANNAFDGVLTFLGILMGNLVLNEVVPSVVIKIGLSTCLAIGMSGAFGRFLSERAERKRVLRQMEKDMFTKLGDTSLEREGTKKMVIISFVDGITPALAAVIPLSPFFLAQASVISVTVSIVASFVLMGIVLFALGMFLGKTAEENMFLYGGLVVAVGFVTSLIILSASILSR
jgi:predicted membrane protein (TIGR00267 family)